MCHVRSVKKTFLSGTCILAPGKQGSKFEVRTLSTCRVPSRTSDGMRRMHKKPFGNFSLSDL
jgi:hypothetical protein